MTSHVLVTAEGTFGDCSHDLVRTEVLFAD